MARKKIRINRTIFSSVKIYEEGHVCELPAKYSKMGGLLRKTPATGGVL